MKVALAAFAFLATVACGRPEQPVAEGEVADFHVLFQENCSGCHGEDGKYGPSRNLHDPQYLVLIPKDTLRSTVEIGRPGTAMPAFAQANGGSLSEAQITALVNGIESQWAKPVQFAGLTPPAYAGDGQTGDSVNGKKLFMRACFMCHYPGGKVGVVTDPSYLSLVSDQWLRSSIIAGRSDLGMPDWRVLNARKPLTDGDVSDLIAYLTSLRPPGLLTSTKPPDSPANPPQSDDQHSQGQNSSSQSGGVGGSGKSDAGVHKP